MASRTLVGRREGAEVGVLRGGPPSRGGGELESLARELVRAGVATAVGIGAAVRARDAWVHETAAAGRLGGAANEAGAGADTIFDLASVTKPLTALAAARLARANKLDFRATVSTWLPEAQGTASQDAPLELLLAH